MRRTSVCFLLLLFKTTAVTAQTASADSQMTQAMLAEIRQLRQDLQTTAATIQRAQIVMYRLQVEGAVLDRATQRLEQARAGCNQAQQQRKLVTTQIEQAEARKRNSHSSSDQTVVEELISRLKSSVEMWAGEEQQCQIEQVDAESQLRAEQTKMNDLQDQLDKLDKILAAYAGK
jgi:uncharacterized protein YhaN